MKAYIQPSIRVITLETEQMLALSAQDQVHKTSEGYKLASRFFIQAQMKFYTATEVTDSPWLTVLCSGVLGIAATIAGIVSFRNQDLK